MSGQTLVILSSPYRSLGRTGLRVLLGVVIVVNAVGAVAFGAMGAWPVSGFMGLDVLAVYVAFRLSNAQAQAFERISITPQTLTVERCSARGRTSTASLPAYWAQVVFDGDETAGDIRVRSHGRTIEVGTYLPGPERHLFARRLQQALDEAKRSTLSVEA